MERWILRNPKVNIEQLSKESGVSELLCRILAGRQVTEPDSVRELVYGSNKVTDGFLMKDMQEATDIILDAIVGQKRVRIISDYDVDGVISAAILTDALESAGALVDFDIPHRVTDGYGINENLTEAAIKGDVQLIITCDNGISAAAPIKKAREAGISVVVTDHHEVPFSEDGEGKRTYILPPANAIVDMKQADCKYPFKSFCGAGVVYKLVACLAEKAASSQERDRFSGLLKKDMREYMTLCAIATVCDVVDLTGENREILKKGLQNMPYTENEGLKALIEETDLREKKIGVYHLGFILGPCVNASGRLEDAKKAVRLFLTKDRSEAKEIAASLVALNEQRKQMTQKGIDRVISQVQTPDRKKDKVIVAYCPDIHESIAGIVAGRVRERFNLPSIVLTDGESEVKGSGRSIEEYNMFEEIQKCKEYLIKFGGHPMAAGMSLNRENVEKFASRLNEVCTLTDEDTAVKVYVDINLRLDDINMAVAEELTLLEPYGKANPRPVFGSKGVRIRRISVKGAMRNVLSMKLCEPGGNRLIDAVFFGEFDEDEIRGYDLVDIAYNVDINEYNSNCQLQLIVQNMRRSGM